MALIDAESGKTLTPEDGQVVCDFCDTPYDYDVNLLTNEWIWVRRCKAKCRRAQPEQRAKFVRSAGSHIATDDKGGN